MKLTFKDLKQEKFVIEAEPSETVRQVKEKIAQVKSGYDADRTKVIYSGKILQDDKTVESYNIQEKDFLVCLPSKQPKAAPSASAAPSTPAARAPAATPAAPPAPAPAAASAPAVPATPSPADRGTQPAGRDAAFNDPSTLAMGSAAEGAVSQMEAMGFARSDIERAMRAAFYNPDRAIEYLLTGIPEHVQQEQQQRQQEQQEPAAPVPSIPAAPRPSGGEEPVNLFEAAAQAGDGSGTRGARGARTGGTPAADSNDPLANLDFLRSNPHFQQLRQLVQQQPHMLEPILQQVAAGNPQIAQIIGQNSEQFLQLLSEDFDEDDEANLPPGTQAVSVTPEERDAIERLCRLGFPRDSVIQAYFACDKNEELAANFLFEQPDEDEE
ncbi:UV excision repair protein (RadW) [Penicillium longicatenatum]|uniref:UV excision repair protein (RadW) n=1 Tax=Penicillium longicatenatum TaxID=1561947 RepID=UPI002548E168|nr:UV excision repair protein (RadW) [Penicillium longicatenatum]KAJ5643022.1 UV excision repair protein (RadW) [Penicillium longicatenatum]KAJ5645593.1 UV excision repair protein (RadW) [Penicillium longicatenatum]